MAKRFWTQRGAACCLTLLLLLLLFTAVAGALLQGGVDARVNLASRAKPPSSAHLLGTDPSGRDMLTQLIVGTRNSLLIALAITVLTCAFGTMFGLVSGYFGGVVDMTLMRLLDFASMLPRMMLVIVVVSLIPNYGPVALVMVMSAVGWMYDARIVRGKVLQLRDTDFVRASRTMGTRQVRIMRLHILPHLLSTIIVDFTLNLAGNIGIESGLSFLGFGLPFETPSLGTLLSYARVPENLSGKLWLWLPASLLMLGVMLCVHCVGQALKRAVSDTSK